MKKGGTQNDLAVAKFDPTDEIDLRKQNANNAFNIRP
jgi:hypothetical protein